MYVFRALEEVRVRTQSWLADYLEVLPHDSLEGLNLAGYRVLHHPETSSNGTDPGTFTVSQTTP